MQKDWIGFVKRPCDLRDQAQETDELYVGQQLEGKEAVGNWNVDKAAWTLDFPKNQ